MFAGGGSPPLARGTDLGNIFAVARKGITPACAGNRNSGKKLFCQLWDHPRLRGEQYHDTHVHNVPRGSPPLARGTDYPAAGRVLPYGITPACAGNSANRSLFVPLRQDHPRLRGEQSDTVKTMSIPAGSPPLARGTVGGNIAHRQAAQDHPRLRGEQASLLPPLSAASGSPPLARGTAPPPCRVVLFRGSPPLARGTDSAGFIS